MVDFRITRGDPKFHMEPGDDDRVFIKDTDIWCDRCKKDNFVVEAPGRETARWLRCPKCGQFCYWTEDDKMFLACWYTRRNSQPEYRERVRGALKGGA